MAGLRSSEVLLKQTGHSLGVQWFPARLLATFDIRFQALKNGRVLLWQSMWETLSAPYTRRGLVLMEVRVGSYREQVSRNRA